MLQYAKLLYDSARSVSLDNFKDDQGVIARHNLLSCNAIEKLRKILSNMNAR